MLIYGLKSVAAKTAMATTVSTPLSLLGRFNGDQYVYLMSSHMTKSPRPSTSIFANCKQSKTAIA